MIKVSRIIRNEFLRTDYIYARLLNDILSFSYPDIYLLNQEGDINRQNTFKKKKIQLFKNFIDGGEVIRKTRNYSCYYAYDLKSNARIKGNRELHFRSYIGVTGLNLLDFIDSVLKGDPSIFTKMEDYVFYDIRKHLFEIAEIYVSDTTVDNTFIKTVKKYFHKLEKIEFTNCIIKSECDFSNIKQELTFTMSVIENIRSFNNSEANVIIGKSDVIKISPSVINSQKFELSETSFKNLDIKVLFLKCSFPNLKSIIVSTNNYFNYSYEDAFIYLPSSAPSLESITIYGKIKDSSFLTEFKYLSDILILSTQDDNGLFLPYITSSNERKKIYERNKNQLEIDKILYPSEDEKQLLAKIEIERIKRLSHFLSRISYTDVDKIFENNNIKLLAHKQIDSNVPCYYECWYDTLVYKKQSRLKEFYRYDGIYHIFNSHLCRCNSNTIYNIDKKQIVRSVPFLYALNGLPIVFKSNYKPISSKEEAKKIAGTYDEVFTDYEYEKFIEELKHIALEDKIMPAEDFINRLNMVAHFFPIPDDFMKFGFTGRKIGYTLDTLKRSDKRCDDIDIKITKYLSLYNKTIMDNYDSFTIEEKKYIYGNGLNHFENATNDNMDESILESIDLKTDGMYSKYYNYINGFGTLQSINPYNNLSIDTRDIKKMVLH